MHLTTMKGVTRCIERTMKCGVRPKVIGTSYTLVRVIHTPTTFLILLINIFKYLSALNPIHYYKNI